MTNVVYESGYQDFAEDENSYVAINHSLGYKPKVIQFYGDLEGELGFPTITGVGGVEIDGPYLDDVEDLNTLKVYKPDAYTYSGGFRIVIYN